MPRGRADIANTALRIFLQEMGAAYDEERGRSPYRGTKDQFAEIRDFFGQRCCYCGVEFSGSSPVNQDHLIPMNKTDLGLHAWGNVVPACQACNNARQRTDWRDYIIESLKTWRKKNAAMVLSTQSIDATDAAYIRCVRSRPYIEINWLTPSFNPGSTMPPLRELAPHPIVSPSSTVTFAPAFANLRAADKPVKPAPMTATSAVSGSARDPSVAGISTVVNQKFCSLITE